MGKHLLDDDELEAVTGGRAITPCPYQMKHPGSACNDELKCPDISYDINGYTITYYCARDPLVSWQELLPGKSDL